MLNLPAALEPLAHYDQFIIWKAVPSRLRPGKTDKFGLHPGTGRVHDVHDPAIWMSAADALAAADVGQDGIGFVLTDDDPFFFLDVDGAWSDETSSWSQIAVELTGSLAGAAVEISQSRYGLHILGVGNPGPHKCKNHQHGIELYTSKRFVALTGHQAVGSAGADVSAALSAVVAEYFSRNGNGDDPGASGDQDWTTEPHPDWRGPDDDDELIGRALRAKSAASAFGGGVTFTDLWTGNAEALGTRWPDIYGAARPWDYSEADASLAQHLAFWTGGDCDRIFRLMWKSALVREKWSDRAAYLERTIKGACARQTRYYQQRELAPVVAPVGASDSPVVVTGYRFLSVDSQLEHFKGCVYVQHDHKVFTPSGAMLKPEQFNATYGGYVFQLDDGSGGNKTTKKAWEAFTESQVIRWPVAEQTCFRPEIPSGAIVEEEGAKMVNTYVPAVVERRDGDPEPFLSHLRRVLPDAGDQQILLAYLAACVQYPGIKFQWCPLLQGTEGNGKTLFARCVERAVGQRYTHFPNARDIDNKFNAWVSGKLFIGIEDIYVPENRTDVIESLKPLITNDRIEIQAKGSNQRTGDNLANFLLNTNHKNAIRKTRSDRRFAVFFTAQQGPDDLKRDGMSGDYFPNLYRWLKRQHGYAIVAKFLAEYPIADHLNPATNCHRAPATSSTEAAISDSLGSVEQEVLEAVDEGRQGFAGGWISSLALDRLLTNLRAERVIPRRKRRELLQDLGYDHHPALPSGRVSRTLLEDGGKPRLFVRHGHPALEATDQDQVIEWYLAAQRGEQSLEGVR